MFKLESYVAPLLIGYIDKYVKLKKDDFQVSLWGGDVVLNKLELRLDVIESLIKIPISLRSGWVHELRVHVPWTHLYSEPVEITINTIECTVKLKNSDSSSESTDFTPKQSSLSSKRVRSSPAIEGQDDLPPGYLQSLLNKIVNNMNIIVNNLILKFVDDDIVLSLNVKSAECYSTSAEWNRSFADLTPEDLVLRRILEIHDLTLCLDQRNASGKIEHYQTPLLYRCALTARLAMFYESLYSKLPHQTKLNINCESFNLSLTDIQIPMFQRLLRLFISLYYESSNVEDFHRDVEEGEGKDEDLQADAVKSEEGIEEGWVSWAWSYVPPILPTNQGSDLDVLTDLKKKAESAALIVGLHIKCLQIRLQRCVVSRSRGQLGFEKMSFVPYVAMNFSKVNLDMRFQGQSFTDVQFGIDLSKAYFHCACLDAADDKISDCTDLEFFCGGGRSGAASTCKSSHSSLFDDGDGVVDSFATSEEEHVKVFSEKFARQNFGFFWMNFLYVADPNADDAGRRSTPLSVLDLNERSLCRFFVGKSELKFTPRLHVIVKQLVSLLPLEQETFQSRTFKEFEDAKQSVGEDDAARLETNCIVCRYALSVALPAVVIYPGNFPTSGHRCVHSDQATKKSTGATGSLKTPAIAVDCERLDFNFSAPMYPRLISRACSGLASPSEQVMHNCHSLMFIQILKLRAHLQLMGNQPSNKKCLIQPLNLTFHQKLLLHPNFWNNPLQSRDDWLLEGESLVLNATKAQLFLSSYIVGSWFGSEDRNAVKSLSLVADVFDTDGSEIPLSLEMTLPSFEVHYVETSAVHAISGCVTSFLVLMLGCENGRQFLLPLLYGPLDMTHVHSKSSLSSSSSVHPSLKENAGDLVSFACQFQKNSSHVEAPGGAYAKVLGISFLLDPVIYDWLAYSPQEIPNGQADDTSVVIDTDIALATDPLNSSFIGSESGSRTAEQNIIASSSFCSNVAEKKPESFGAWKNYICDIYPLLKILEVEVNVKTCCLFASSRRIHPTSPPTVDVPLMIHSVFLSGNLPDTFVFVLPTLDLTSAGLSVQRPLPSVPIKSLEHSATAGEKLPWKLKFSDASVYSLHDSKRVSSLVEPFTVCCTMALNVKYKESNQELPTQEVLQLATCLHCDVDAVCLSLSSHQILLAGALMNELNTALENGIGSLKCLSKLLRLRHPVEKMSTSSNVRSLQNNQTEQQRLESPNVASLSNFHEVAQVSEGASEDLSFDLKEEEGHRQETDKLSLWLQLTLNKLLLDVALDAQSKKNLGLSLTCEFSDLTNSFDVHESYIKVKSKVNSLSVRKFSERGAVVLMSSDVSLPRHLRFVLASRVTSRTDESGVCFPGGSSKSKNSSQSTLNLLPPDETEFLNFVFTRVVESSSLEKFARTYESRKFRPSGRVADVYEKNKHLDEICANLRPFVVVLDSDAMLAVAHLSDALSDLVRSSATKLRPTLPDVDANPSFPLSSSELPLLHFSMKGLHVVLNAGPSFVEAVERDAEEKSIEDAIVVCLDSIDVVPYADNPLPRLVVDRNVYSRAVHLGALGSLPGYPLENRQYQADLVGLAVAATSWENIFGNSADPSRATFTSVVQNPALEWNSDLRQTNHFHVGLLMSNVNVQVIFAPAVVCSERNQQKKLVCGHSLEVNASSELELCLTVPQIKLLAELAAQCSDLLTTRTSTVKSEETRPTFEPKESSAVSITRIPFDVLVTGIRLNVMTYSDVAPTPSKNLVGASRFALKPFLCCFVSQPYIIVKFDGADSSSKLEVSCYDACVKSLGVASTHELRRRSPPHLLDPLSPSFCPSYSDFVDVVMETKQGKPDPNTGVLSSLCTICITDFHALRAEISMKIDRPVRLSFSKEHVEMFSDFSTRLQDALKILDGFDDDDDDGESLSRSRADGLSGLSLLSFRTEEDLKWLQSASLSSVQLFFVWGVKVGKDETTLKLSLKNANFLFVAKSQKSESQSSIANCNVKLTNLVLLASSGKRTHRLVGPSCVEVRSALVSRSFPAPPGSARSSVVPSLDVFFASDVVVFQLSKEVVRLLSDAIKHFPPTTPVETGSNNSSVGAWSANNSSVGAWSAWSADSIQAPELTSVEFHDDLKSNSFAFLHDGEKNLPSDGEITYQTNVSCSSMTWRYREPRIISRLVVVPVPFRFNESLDDSEDDERFKGIPCSLQYSLDNGMTFKDFSSFCVGNSELLEVQLPPCDGKSAAVSCLWRTVLLKGVDGAETADGRSDGRSQSNDLLSPLLLASCLRIDSKIVPDLTPRVNVVLSLGKLEVVLKNLGQNFGAKSESHGLADHRAGTLRFGDATVNVRSMASRFSGLRINFASEIECQILEYAELTWLKLLDRMPVDVDLSVDVKNSEVDVVCSIDVARFLVSQQIMHTLNFLCDSWSETQDFKRVASCCLVSNDTQTTLYFGQVGGNEAISLSSRHSHQYFWSNSSGKKELWFGVKKSDGRLENNRVSLERNDCKQQQVVFVSDGRVLLVDVEGSGKVQCQLKVRGNLTIGNNLDLTVCTEVQIPGEATFSCRLNPEQLLPSLIVPVKETERTKVRVSLEESGVWSEEMSFGSCSLGKSVEVHLHGREACIWFEVIVQKVSDANEYLILFSPMFVVRSHYPLRLLMNVVSSRPDENMRVSLDGKGRRTTLHCSDHLPLDVTFQLVPDMPASNPVLSLTSKTIRDVRDKKDPDFPSVAQITQQWGNWNVDLSDVWPYNSIDASVISPTQLASDCSESYAPSHVLIPNIELSINLSKQTTFSNTLVVELSPRWMVINECKLDLIISDRDSPDFWSLPSSKAFVPPVMAQFVVGMLLGGRKHVSDVVTLLDEELPSPYQPPDDLRIAVESHAVFSIPVLHCDKLVQQLHLSIHSTWKHHTRIVTIRERFLIINRIPYFLQLYACVLSPDQTQADVNDSIQPTAFAEMQSSASEVVQPLLLWTYRADQASTRENSFVVCLRASDAKRASNFTWSCPVQLDVNSVTVCYHIVLPCSRSHGIDEDVIPCCLTLHVEKTLVYLVVDLERYAYIKVFNECSQTLCLAVPQRSEGGVTDATISSQTVRVKPSSQGYFCPHLSATSLTFYPFRVILGISDPDRPHGVSWSPPLEVNENLSLFAKLGANDVKVESVMKEFICHLHVSPIVRADVSSREVTKEIRRTVASEPPGRFPPGNPPKPMVVKPPSALVARNKSFFGFAVNSVLFIRNAYLLLRDDLKKCSLPADDVLSGSKEVLLVAMEDVYLSLQPRSDEDAPDSMYRLDVVVGDLQVDNRAFVDGTFDFPVVVLRSQDDPFSKKSRRTNVPLDRSPPQLPQNPFFDASVELFGRSFPELQVNSVVIKLSPLILCLEDTLIYSFVDYFYSLDTRPTSDQSYSKNSPRSLIPADVKLISSDLANPVRLHKLTIEPVKILISFHASMKIFLALDSSPMNFRKFEKLDIWLTRQQLSKLLTMHFVTSALLRTGVVVGSLEILGNPTGFVRSISTGVSDMICLPYNGLTLGPASCITGFSNGIKSIVKHFSAGTLTSISNFSSGISRNMERLSMDADHVGRIERMRRRRPRGFSDGLLSGLAGFGLSLLGAIAGLADQPLQMFMSPANDNLSASSKARGVVSGLGKGLIGMIAKPIGGAAELVSMTSIGIMHGAGLAKIYKQKDYKVPYSVELQSHFMNRISLLNGVIKCKEDEEYFYCLDDCGVSSGSEECLIVLTSSVVHVWNRSEDVLLCSYPVSDIYLSADYNASEILFFVSSLEEHSRPFYTEGTEYDLLVKNSKRIEEYISMNQQQQQSKLSAKKGTDSTSDIMPFSPAKLKLKYRIRFLDRRKAAELLCFFDYAFCSKDAGHFFS